MTEISESYRKVPYDLREAKQVERRMIIDAFQRLSAAGFPIADYQYTGMGSIYFVDFILFHKYLGIKHMLSVEISKKIEKRIDFNRPFGNVEVQIEPIGTVLPSLHRDRRHIVWLDYDNILCAGYASDIIVALSSLPAGSMLFITVDAEPPRVARRHSDSPTADAEPSGVSRRQTDGPKEWREYFTAELSDYLPRNSDDSTFARSQLPAVNVQMLDNIISRGMRSRSLLKFEPMFNFSYKDGHRMVTVGGMICADDDMRKLRSAGLEHTLYYRSSFDDPACELAIPRFTRKERYYLDWAMPCTDDWVPSDFEVSAEEIKSYRDIYRFLPLYGEFLF